MKRSIGYLYAIISAVLFGTSGLFVKMAYKTGLDSLSLLTVQYIFGAIIIFTIAFIKNRKSLLVSKKDLINLAIMGVVGNTFMTLCYYKAFEYLSVAMVTLLLYTYPIIVFIYTLLLKKEKITKKKIVALLAAFIGCMFTLNIFSGNLSYSIIGIGLGILSAMFYAFMNIYSEEKLQNLDALAINAYSTLFSLLFSFTILMVSKFPTGIYIFKGAVSSSSILYVIALALFCETIPLTLLYGAIKLIGAFKVSVIGNIEIPTAMVLGFFMLKESVTLIQIIGAIMIIYAVYLIKN